MTNFELALSLCKGSYQLAIVKGEAKLSGADLRGRARRWSAGYWRSRKAIIARLDAAGVTFTVTGDGTAKGGARYLLVAP